MNGRDKDNTLIDVVSALSSLLPGGGFERRPVVSPLVRGGSERRFFRISGGGQSVVAMVGTGDRHEVELYDTVGRFLHRNGIPVPEIYGLDARHGIIVMEDVGDAHLEDVLHGASGEGEHAFYAQCINVLVRLETVVTDAMTRAGLLENRIFDEDALLAETEYFQREFIEDYCPVPIPRGWHDERTLLARALAAQPRVFMHRDFQSRNILVKNGTLRIVDFQAAHRGPGLYDAASLLKDAYHPVVPETRTRLLRELHEGLRTAGCAVPRSFDEFRETFALAGIQRNLQALAAFARLGSKRGKREFLASIPVALRLLAEGVAEAGRFPAITAIVDAIGERTEKGRR